MVAMRWADESQDARNQVMQRLEMMYSSIGNPGHVNLEDFLLPEEDCEDWHRRRAAKRQKSEGGDGPRTKWCPLLVAVYRKHGVDWPPNQDPIREALGRSFHDPPDLQLSRREQEFVFLYTVLNLD